MYVVCVYVCVMWMYGVYIYVFVCSVYVCGVDVWCLYMCVCVCMCWKVAGIFTCYSDSAIEAPENVLPQTLAGLSQLIFTHRLYTKCC